MQSVSNPNGQPGVDVNTPPLAADATVAINPFDPARLRLSQDFASAVGVKKVLTTVPCRKPHRHEFVRVRTGAEWRLETGVFEDKINREVYLVDPPLFSALLGEVHPVCLFCAVTRQNDVLLWPVKSNIEAILDSYVAPYGVTGFNGGPWTLTSVAELPYDFTGYENAGSPLRKSLGIEIVTDQEGSGIKGSGDVTFDVSAVDGTGVIASTGTGSVSFDVSTLSGSGFQPNAGPGAVSFAVSALAAAGSVPLAGPGSVTFGAALAGTGSIPNLGSGGVSFESALAGVGTWGLLASGGIALEVSGLFANSEVSDTNRRIKHFEHSSNMQRVSLG